MATGRKKCICQICTCGKHICPHNKKRNLILKDNGNGDSGVRRPNGQAQDGAKMSITTSRTEKSGKSDTRSINGVIRASGKRASAVLVPDKGNAKTWSAKQVPKTLSIKPPDNLKPEGPLELTTTHQQDFTEKHRERTALTDYGIEQSESFDYSKDSWNQRQKPKTLAVKKSDHFKTTGPLNGNGVDVSSPLSTIRETAKESVREDATDFSQRVAKEKFQRPKTSLKPEGLFESETLYQKDFTPRQTDLSPKQTKNRPQSNLKPEGSMFFDTTSLDYSAIRKAEEDQDKEIRPKKHRPQSQLKIPPVPLATDTTVTSDFRSWNVEKPPRRKPQDNLKRLGRSDSTDEDLLSQIRSDTYHEDFKQWDVSRPVLRKPEPHLKPEGDIAFVTTHNADYTARKEMLTEERNADVEPEIEMDEASRKATEPDAAAESPEAGKETRQPSPAADDAAADIQDVPTDSHAQNDILAKQVRESKFHEEYPEVTDVASNEDLSSENGQYVTWDQIRPKPIRPHSNLRQEGGMEFTTTNRTEFVQRPFDRVRGYRPTTTTRIAGELFTTTTNQAMFKEPVGDKPRPIRPKSNLLVEDGTFSGETTFAREFKAWPIDKPGPITHKSTLSQEGSMEFTTTNHVEFEPKFSEKVSPIRPKTTNQVYEKDGEFDGMTTNRSMHQRFEAERMDPIKPETNLKPHTGPFYDETTMRREFQEWKFDRPNPVRPRTNMRQEGDMDFTTMNQVQFQEKTAEPVSQIRPHTSSKISGDFDGTTINQVMFKAMPIERVKQIIPKRNLFMESGEFEGETTSHREFQSWRPSDKQSTYGLGGEFGKQRNLRPQTHLQIEDGTFAGGTTARDAYQEWESSKRDPIKPRSSIRNEGDFDFTTLNHSEFPEKALERTLELRPTTSTKITGDFDGTTMNQVMFKNIPSQRQAPIMPRPHLHMNTGIFSDETTTHKEYQRWNQDKQGLIRPRGNLAQEGEMLFTTSNAEDFGEKQIERVAEMRPHTTENMIGDFQDVTTNRISYTTPPLQRARARRLVRDSGDQIIGGPFQNNTTMNTDYVYRYHERAEPVRPKSNLHQEGDLNFITSNQLEFSPKTTDRPKQIKPGTAMRLPSGEFYDTTTNRATFGEAEVEKVRPIRPHTNLRPEGGHFYDNTTARDEFQEWIPERPAPVMYSDTLKQEGDMQFETTNRREFTERSTDRPHPVRPKTTTKIEGEYDNTTTNQVMFNTYVPERVKPIRQKDNLFVEEGKFCDETTSRREFKQWVKQPHRKVNRRMVKQFKAAGIPTQKYSADDRRGSSSSDSEKKQPSRRDSRDRHLQSHTDSQVESDDKPYGTPKLESKETQATETNVEDEQTAQEAAKLSDEQQNGEITELPDQQETQQAVEVAPVGHGRTTPDDVIKESADSESGQISATEKSKMEDAEDKKETSDRLPSPGPWKLADGSFYVNKERESSGAVKPMPPAKAIKRYKPEDNLRLENVPFDGDSTTRIEFRKWEASRSSPKKRSPVLRQEGEMFFSTTADDYSKREAKDDIPPATKRTRKPQEHLKQVGEMQFSTTTNSSYVGNTITKTKNLRPKSSLKIGIAEALSGNGWHAKDRSTDLTTTTMSAYKEIAVTKTRANRPTTSQKVGGHFEGKSTTQSTFTAVPLEKLEKTRPFKPEKSSVFNGDDGFNGNTTYRCSFDTLKQNKHCPVLDLEKNPNEYQFKEEVNGHRFYLPLVQG